MFEVINDYHSMKGTSGTIGQSSNDFERLGHTGRWVSSISVTGATEVNFTGSNYGAGGVIITSAGQTIHLSKGGTIPGSALTIGIVHELAVSKVVSTSGTCYVLIRNPQIR